MKKIFVLCCLVLVGLLFGCQSVNDGPLYESGNFKIDKEVTEIEVVDWKSEEHIAKITDQDFISELINELSNANISTAKVDIPNPDYKLIFISGIEAVYELGYYRQSMNTGVIGRYWDSQKDGLYGVTINLPFDN